MNQPVVGVIEKLVLLEKGDKPPLSLPRSVTLSGALVRSNDPSPPLVTACVQLATSNGPVKFKTPASAVQQKTHRDMRTDEIRMKNSLKGLLHEQQTTRSCRREQLWRITEAGGGASKLMAENRKLNKILVAASVHLCACHLLDLAGGVSLRDIDVSWRLCRVSGCFQEWNPCQQAIVGNFCRGH